MVEKNSPDKRSCLNIDTYIGIVDKFQILCGIFVVTESLADKVGNEKSSVLLSHLFSHPSFSKI